LLIARSCLEEPSNGPGQLDHVAVFCDPGATVSAKLWGAASPIVLNASIDEDEPFVRTREDALETLRRTHKDVLELGNFALTRDRGPD
jgi:hypothetical protein